MNNLSLIKHEIKRLVFNKKYFYMSLILILSTSDKLLRLVIHGEYGTAPFSKWSYSNFTTLISPLLITILILLSTNVFSEKEIKARKIIYSTPITQTKYYTIKAASIFIAYLTTLFIPIIISFIYYGVLFKFYNYASFIKPIIYFLIPSFILFLGLCMIVGKMSLKLLYALIPFAFLNGLNFKFPVWIDLYGNNFLLNYGYTVWKDNTTGIVPYNIPMDFMISRAIFVLFGIILFVITCKKSETI
ncbi:hypothetical protein [Maledivibacter halophilus]|uniref:ABC-2 type transport system permease protein n=1 Tax=Maledivibacter halophilus TaxID=36842 RepID=A0A1T5MK27_9FIRM|nr:hypothetical protein [Maledivibacter halophilus]SKC88278.1 hypothetical protein SAMN02194393_04847 [Maledivibacter halophilus]